MAGLTAAIQKSCQDELAAGLLPELRRLVLIPLAHASALMWTWHRRTSQRGYDRGKQFTGTVAFILLIFIVILHAASTRHSRHEQVLAPLPPS